MRSRPIRPRLAQGAGRTCPRCPRLRSRWPASRTIPASGEYASSPTPIVVRPAKPPKARGSKERHRCFPSKAAPIRWDAAASTNPNSWTFFRKILRRDRSRYPAAHGEPYSPSATSASNVCRAANARACSRDPIVPSACSWRIASRSRPTCGPCLRLSSSINSFPLTSGVGTTS